MTTENVDSQVQEQAAQDALSAGFNKVRGDEPPAEVPPTINATEETTEAKTDVVTEEVKTETPEPTEPKVTEEAPVEEPVFAGLKESELKALLANASKFTQMQEAIETNNRKVFGRFGELQGELKKLQSQPAGQPIKVTGEKLKRLRDSFPELADVLAEDLSELFTAPAGAFDQSQVDKIVAEKLEEANQKTELKLLTIAHPDWYEKRHTPDFDIWLTTLPPEVSDRVQESEDSVFLTKAFTAFKGWKTAADEATKAASEASAAKQKNDKRLEASVTPSVTATAPPKPTASNAMSAGFKRVRGG